MGDGTKLYQLDHLMSPSKANSRCNPYRLWALLLLLTVWPAWAQTNPPFILVPLTNHTWRYDASGMELGSAWRSSSYDDTVWASGLGLLAFENQAPIPSLTRTTLPLTNGQGSRILTYYFRTTFVFTNVADDVLLYASNYLDDGAVFYLNGAEAWRYNLPEGNITANTLALAANPGGEGVPVVAELPTDLLVPGTNLLAVEVHQNSPTSLDIVFGTALIVRPIPPGPPIIGIQPVAGTNVAPGGRLSLSVSNAGGSRVQYQWFHNGVTISAATNKILTLSNVSPDLGGHYYVTLSNSFGAVTSSVSAVSVTDASIARRLLEFTNVWRFEASGTNLGTAWRAAGYNDTGWPSGAGVFINPRTLPAGFPEPTTPLLLLTNPAGNTVTTFYFRTHFTLPPGASNVLLLASNLLDDGAVFYINGAEAARLRMANGPVTATNFAQTSPIGNGMTYDTLFLAATNLAPGDNVLAVEVHQFSPTSTDVVFGMNLSAFAAWGQGLLLLSEPASQTLPEPSPVTWRANLFGSLPLLIQWFHNNAPLPNATNLTLSIPESHAGDAGSYYFVASNYVNSVTSLVATLTILPDTNAAHVVRAVGTNGLNGVLVVFSEGVGAGATNLANYQLSPLVTILSAEFIAPNVVLLTTSGLDLLADYTLRISNIIDCADSPNTSPPFEVGVGPNRLAIPAGLLQVQTVFLIMMENHAWETIRDNTNAPYLNSLLPQASYCENYVGDELNSPAWLMLEAGDFFGVLDGNRPPDKPIASTNHLVTQLFSSGIEWRGYLEDLPPGSDGTLDSPILQDTPPYIAWRNPFAFFQDVTTNLNYCTNHVRPYSYFAGDLTNGQIGRYNYIMANPTNSMRTPPVGGENPIKTGDDWLARELPLILNSPAYSNNGAVFITWDENLDSTNAILGMIVLSPLAKGGGYASGVRYSHSSILRTMQDIFNVRPYLGKAALSEPMNDLFRDLSVSVTRSNADFVVTAENLLPGRTNYLQVSSNLVNWSTLATNVATSTISAIDPEGASAGQRFFRAIQR